MNGQPIINEDQRLKADELIGRPQIAPMPCWRFVVFYQIKIDYLHNPFVKVILYLKLIRANPLKKCVLCPEAYEQWPL